MSAGDPGEGWAAVLVFVAAVLCCLVPILLLSGGLGVLAGALERHPWAIAVGAGLLLLGAVGVVVRLWSRRR